MIWQYVRRRREARVVQHLWDALLPELADQFGSGVSLQPARSKGGLDAIATLFVNNRPFGVVRQSHPFSQVPCPYERFPRVLQSAKLRHDREWVAYGRLGPAGLSPRALWRNEHAIMCEHVAGERGSDRLRTARSAADIWNLLERVSDGICRMHALGVVHLDLNPGNVLVDAATNGVRFIDIEWAPTPHADPADLRAFDWAWFLASTLRRRRGGWAIAAAPQRWIRLIEDRIDPDARRSGIWDSTEIQERLARSPEIAAWASRLTARPRDGRHAA